MLDRLTQWAAADPLTALGQLMAVILVSAALTRLARR